jgi:hypothetical protein
MTDTDMNNPADHKTPAFKVGDEVIVTTSCDTCNTYIHNTGWIVGIVTDDRDAAGETAGDLYVVRTSAYGFDQAHEVHPAAALTLAERWEGPFCEWCGDKVDITHQGPGCRDFYRQNGRPPTADERAQLDANATF